MKTIFNTPIISGLLRSLSNLSLRAAGWQVEGGFPNLPKFIVVGAPHTSNWDFVLFLGVIFHLKANVRYMGKAELFRPPIGGFFRWCGGIPVDRSKSQGLVEQTAQAIREADEFILVIAPEGTRHEVTHWKTGFYHIARSAGIPLVIAIVDGAHKTVRVGQIFHLTDDMETDMKTIRSYFNGIAGIKPRKRYITLES